MILGVRVLYLYIWMINMYNKLNKTVILYLIKRVAISKTPCLISPNMNLTFSRGNEHLWKYDKITEKN